VTICPMSIPPCDGPWKPGEERFCGKCESQLQVPQYEYGDCFWCDLGRNFGCTRYQ
jgi:hypothetical protein